MTMVEVLNSVQYMVDEDGKRTAAVVQINTWKSLLQLLTVSDFTTLQEAEEAGEAGEAGEAKTAEQIMAAVQARPLNPDSVIMPTGSLLDALQNPTYEDEDFDLEEWTKQWSVVEREMKAITHQNDIAEGRG